jgi:hypothetical protein
VSDLDLTQAQQDALNSGVTAETNVKPDWSAAAGAAAEILNKPVPFTSATRTTPGLVPAGSGTGAAKYLREDGTWVVPHLFAEDESSAQTMSVDNPDVLVLYPDEG